MFKFKTGVWTALQSFKVCAGELISIGYDSLNAKAGSKHNM